MKTLHYNISAALQHTLAAILLITAASCSNRFYAVDTTVDRNGTVSRTVKATADSAYISGDLTDSPFFGEISAENWNIRTYDTKQEEEFLNGKVSYNITASREYPSGTFGQSAGTDSTGNERDTGLSGKEPFAEYMFNPFASPEEKLEIKRGLFRTKYIYTATFRQIHVPVPLYGNMDSLETELWTRKYTCPEGTNGYEAFEELGNISEKFEKWYSKCAYEATCMAIAEIYEKYGNRNLAETFRKNRPAYGKNTENLSMEEIAAKCDSINGTEGAKILAAHMDEAEKMLERISYAEDLSQYNIRYSVSMPGKVTSTDRYAISRGDSTIWKISVLHLIGSDLNIRAESTAVSPGGIALFIIAATILLIVIPVAARRRYPSRKKGNA